MNKYSFFKKKEEWIVRALAGIALALVWVRAETTGNLSKAVMTQLPSKNHPLGQQYRRWIHWPEVPQKDEDQLPKFVPIHQFKFNIPTEILKTGVRGHLAKMQKTAILSFYTYYREDQSSPGWGTELPLHGTSGSVCIQVYSLWTTLRAQFWSRQRFASTVAERNLRGEERKKTKRLHLTQILKFSLDDRSKDYCPRWQHALSTRNSALTLMLDGDLQF